MRRVQVLVFVFFLIVLPAATQAKSFTDTNGYWAEKEILRLANLGLTDGYQGKFLPKGQVSRAEFAKLAVTALGLEKQAQVVAKAKAPFKDLPTSHWGNGYILLAYENKILTGYPDDTVRPDAPISRVEIAALLMRALKAQQGEFAQTKLTVLSPSLPFTDADTIPEWSRQIIAEAVQRGLISGYEDKTFRPNRTAARGEASVLVSRLLSQLGGHTTYQGIITELNTKDHNLTLQIADQSAQFTLTSDAIFYLGSRRVGLQDIPKGSEVGVVLNPEGKIVFLETNNNSITNNFGFRQKLGKVKTFSSKATQVNTAILAEAEQVDFNGHPEASLELTKKEMNLDQFRNSTRASGEGQLIAIIDTGVDPSHPDLLVTSSGKRKIVNWVDFTSEGLLNIPTRAEIINDTIELEQKTLRIPAELSKSGIARLGVWKEAEIPVEFEMGLDLNGNDLFTDEFNIAAFDQARSGVYDTVIVDTDQDGDFRDEVILKKYKDSQQPGRFTNKANGKRFGFVLAELKEDGSTLKFGFDSNGHGTHVAGIAAGSGQINGVAPGAQLMVLKAMNSNGTADWSAIADAVSYAVKNGAKIVNLSLGVTVPESVGNNGANRLLQMYMETQGVIFVVAAGNSGPGLTTITTPADTEGVISVGAYISPAMWKQDFNWDVSKESLWYFSSMGPRFDGAMMPQFIAPGSAVSTSPYGEYKLAEGTSMAAPHVAGAVALLLDSAARNKVECTPAKVRQALSMGAKPIEGFTEVEQGYGKIDVLAAWEHLQQVSEQPLILAKAYNWWLGNGIGLYAREFVPGQLNFQIQNLAVSDARLKLKTTEAWLKPQQDQLFIPKLTSRQIRMDYQVPEEPGLYTARLVGEIEGKHGSAIEIFNTLIRPYPLDQANNYRQTMRQTLPAGQYKRYFFRVDEGFSSLQIQLAIELGAGEYLGRARLHLYNPLGEEINQDLTDFAGVGFGQPKDSVDKVVEKPMAGIWEVVVYSSATLSEFRLYESRVELNVEAKLAPIENNGSDNSNTSTNSSLSFADSKYLVGVTEGTSPNKTLTNDAASANSATSLSRPENVTFQVRLKENLQPYEGVMEINSKLYNVNQGRVAVRVADLVTETTSQEPITWVISLPGA